MEYFIVPLGINCTTAIALSKLNIRKIALPFDYITTASFTYIRKVLVLEQNNVEQFVNEYFSYPNFNKETCKSIDGTEFPHTIENQHWVWGGDEIIEKYIRRIKRLLNIINNEQKVIFITGSFNYDKNKNEFNESNYTDITNYIKHVRSNKETYFITYNLFNENFKIDPNHINFNIKLVKGPDDIDYDLIGEKLKNIINLYM